MKPIAILVMAVAIVPAMAQSSHNAEVFTSQQIETQFAGLMRQANTSGSGGATLSESPSHKIMLSVRTKSGGPEMHAHYDDIFIVRQGKATLITGGTILDLRTNGNGDSTGSAIRNGKSQVIAKGDIVQIPAETPHQLRIGPGVTFSSLVIKVRE